MLAGVSTRRYRVRRSRSAPRSRPGAVDVEVVGVADVRRAHPRTLPNLMSRRLDDVRLAVMMLDGIDLQDRANVVALGITTEGEKLALGLWYGSTENATVVTALLADLVDRGLDLEAGHPVRHRRLQRPSGKPSGWCSATTCPSSAAYSTIQTSGLSRPGDGMCRK